MILKRQEAIQMMTTDMENLTMEAVKEETNFPMRRQETIKRTKPEIKEEFNEAELANMKEWASRMEMNAEFGCLNEANTLFGLLFEKMKEKKFGLSQRKVKWRS